LTDPNQEGVESLRTFSVVRRDIGSPSGDRLVGHLSGSGIPAGSLHCLIGLHESWVWCDAFEEVQPDGLLSISLENAELRPKDESLYLLPPAFQPPISFIILDKSKTWEQLLFHEKLAASSRVLGTDGQWWRRLRPIDSEGELEEGESLEVTGWDHEHCSLCNKHIEPGDIYFFRAWEDGGYYLCIFCHERFALSHSIGEVIYPAMGIRANEEE
jgi:hypothetical protein